MVLYIFFANSERSKLRAGVLVVARSNPLLLPEIYRTAQVRTFGPIFSNVLVLSRGSRDLEVTSTSSCPEVIFISAHRI